MSKLLSPDLIKITYEDLSLTVPEVIKKLGLKNNRGKFICQKTFNKYLMKLNIPSRGKGRGNKHNRYLMPCCKYEFEICTCGGVTLGIAH
jgi:hypothetical protein